MFSLRDYQIRGVNDIRNTYLRGFRAPLYVLSTGGGKTVIFAYIASEAALKGKKVLILVHRVELLRQTASKLRSMGVRVGLISPKYTADISAPVQVAMVQTVINRFHHYPHFDLIITDEAHHAVAGNYVKVQTAYPSSYHLGVTATPCRGDGLGLGKSVGGAFDVLVQGPTTKELISKGFLVQPVMFAPKTQIDLSGVRYSMGDYNRKDLASAVDKKTITGNAVEYYQSYVKNQPAVCFCVSVNHAEHVAADFRQSGYRFYPVDGGMDDDKRERVFKMLGDGSIDGVTSCDLISEGTDIPAIAAAFLLRPTQSTGLYIQQVGRALRPSQGKEKAYIFDHANNHLLHGFPEDERQWSLDGEKRKRRKSDDNKNVRVAQCKECYAVFRPTLRSCPECGHLAGPVGRLIDSVDGELVELTESDKMRLKREKQLEVARAKTLDDLINIEQDRNYRPGWAQHMFNARQSKANR